MSVALLLVAAALAQAAPFREAARERGVDFVHQRGARGQRYIPEIMGSGVALLDHDGDGDLDLLFAQLGALEDPGGGGPPRLYRNDGGRFTDVSAGSGLDGPAHAMGVAVGDVDGDGRPDVLFTAFGADRLYRNLGGGRFEDATAVAGLGDARWTSSAAFLDYDSDGDLDLYVVGYLDFDPARFEPCEHRGVPVYCGPERYPGLADRLYRNDGAGRFEDVTREAGLAELIGKGLGVVATDWDLDGDVDLYVANDGTPNLLLLNRLESGVAGFAEDGVLRGVAFGETGLAEAGMGVDAGDWDGDGDPDLVCANLEEQPHSLYRNDAGIGLESRHAVGLAQPTRALVGFGVAFVDFDLDGDLDLVGADGHILDNAAQLRPGSRFEQPLLVLENRNGRFASLDVAAAPAVGRGLAVGDLDDDGDPDLLVSNNGGGAYLLLNQGTPAGPVIGLRLEGVGRSNRDAYGARVSWGAGPDTRVRELFAARSYLSSSDPRLLLALAPGQADAEVSVTWPDGVRETHRLAPGAYHHLVEGRGVVGSRPFTRGSPAR